MTTTRTVLIIEDDRFLRRACEASLKQRGLTVVATADGEDGLRAALAAPPDLVLLDMLMPRMTGLEVLRALRSDPRTRHVKVLVVSNSSREGDVDAMRALGIVDYLVKANLSLQTLGDLVAEALKETP